MSNFHPEYLGAQSDQGAWHQSSYSDDREQSQRQLQHRVYAGCPAVHTQPVAPTQGYSASACAYNSARRESQAPMYGGQASYPDPTVLMAQAQMPYGQQAPYIGPVYSSAELHAPQAAHLSAPHCFNCEGNDHMAAHCTRSRASYQPLVQAIASISTDTNLLSRRSSMHYQYDAPPAKKPRPNYIPPVVTKYEVPDHIKRKHLAQTSKKNEDVAYSVPGPGPAFGQSPYVWQDGSAPHFASQSGYPYEAVHPSNTGSSAFGYNTWPAVQQPSYSSYPAPQQNALPYTPQASPAGQAYAGYQPPPSAVLSQALPHAAYPVGSYPTREMTPIKSTSPLAYSFPVPAASRYETSPIVQTVSTVRHEAERPYPEFSDRRRTTQQGRGERILHGRMRPSTLCIEDGTDVRSEPQRHSGQYRAVTDLAPAKTKPTYVRDSADEYDPLNPAAGLGTGTVVTVSSDGSTKSVTDRGQALELAGPQASQESGTRKSRNKFMNRRAKWALAREVRKDGRSKQGSKASQGHKAPQGPKSSHGSGAPAQGNNNPRQHHRRHKKSKKRRLLAGLGSQPAEKGRNGQSGPGS